MITMTVTQTGKSYAAALFMLASEKGCVEEYDKALGVVSEAFKQNPEYMELLSSPGISLTERLEALEEVFSKVLPEDVLSLIQLLCKNAHIYALHDCALEYKELLNSLNKVKTAKVTTSVKLDDAEKSALKKKLESKLGNNVVLDCSVDKSVLGGINVEVDGKVLDGSLRSRLKDIKDVINR